LPKAQVLAQVRVKPAADARVKADKAGLAAECDAAQE
jgi:hypothetical protein